jgi:hypothetical protein
MSAGDEAFKAEKLLLFTFKGRVTVFFLDGYTVDGELIKQDLLNIYLLVDNEPRMISRSQIRYIAGVPGQAIVPDISSQQAFRGPEAIKVDLIDRDTPFDTAAMAAPRPAAAEFDFDQVDFTEQTGVEAVSAMIDALEDQAVPETIEELASLANVTPDQLEDTGVTFVLPDSAGLVSEIIHQPAAGEGDDATVILGREAEAEDEDDVTAVIPPELEQAITVRLICQGGPHAGEQFEFTSELITLGRARDNDVPLYLDKEISRRHAVIRLENGQFVIQDQNSLNGTYVNNERVDAPRPLHDGDVIFIGVSDLVYQQK